MYNNIVLIVTHEVLTNKLVEFTINLNYYMLSKDCLVKLTLLESNYTSLCSFNSYE